MLPFHSFQGRELKKKQSISQVPLNYENNRPLGYVIPSWFYFVDYHDAPKISKITQSHWLSFTNYNSILFYVALCSFFFPSFSEASPHRTRSHLTSQLCLKWSRVSRGASQEVLVIKKKKKSANAETEEMWAQSLGQEDPLEEGTPMHSSFLVWRIP